VNASGEKIKLLLCDDHRMFRDLVRSSLADEFEIVGEAETGEETLELAIRTKPNVILLDVLMPGIGGLSAARELSKAAHGAKVLIVSQYRDREYVREAFNIAGVAGYLLKTDAASELSNAIRVVHSAKKNYISPSIAPMLLEEIRRPAAERIANDDGLTKREREVIRLISQGSTTKEVASTLHISPKTAQVHRDNLKRKLNLHSTAAMVHYAIAHKLIRID
jgi:DNA-binding NarL/FixJ family response regulator